jgi:cellulose synthase/poly-beta-1,6-N-acetylglucosamine synthase-like glycosyltransferase
MFKSFKVSVVFPAYNEEENIQEAIHDFEKTGYVDEIIVIDNNSKDRTAERASHTSARVVTEMRQGYGSALQRGLKEASGDLIVLAEPDGTFIAADILKLLSYVDDFDLVLGTRTTRELIWKGANMGFFLRGGNLLVAKLLEVLYGGPSFSDCGCTFRLIKKSAYAKIASKLTVNGSHFLPEMVILALRNQLRLIEIPLNYRVRVGDSKITGSLKGAISTGLKMILLILKYRLKPFK